MLCGRGDIHPHTSSVQIDGKDLVQRSAPHFLRRLDSQLQLLLRELAMQLRWWVCVAHKPRTAPCAAGMEWMYEHAVEHRPRRQTGV